METGYINKFCLSLFPSYYVQPQTEAYETLPLFTTAGLFVLPTLASVPSFIHSLMHSQKEQGVGEEVCGGGFLDMAS